MPRTSRVEQLQVRASISEYDEPNWPSVLEAPEEYCFSAYLCVCVCVCVCVRARARVRSGAQKRKTLQVTSIEEFISWT